MSKFSELQNRHERLLSAKMEKTIQKSEVQKFINEIATGGKKISSPRERDQLRANLRYWANYVYEETGIYPNIELLPSNTFMFSSTILLIVLFSLVIVIVSFSLKGYGTSLQAITPTPVATSTPECPVQPASQLLIDPSVSQTKFIMVLFDKSGSYSQYTNSTIELVKKAVLPEIGVGDRLTMAWVSSGVSGEYIFFDERVPEVDFPIIPPTPSLLLTPTLMADGSSTQLLKIQATNVAIDGSNEAIIQRDYSCDIGIWNSEFEKAYNERISQLVLVENEFRDNAVKAVDRSAVDTFDMNTAIYDSLYLASRQFSLSVEREEYDNYILIIFSDLQNRGAHFSPDEYQIDLSEVSVFAAISCDTSIKCQSVFDFWEKEFLSFGVRKTKMLLFPYETTTQQIRDLIQNP